MAKILVVDDDDQVRLMMRQVLERDGYTVATAADGKEAIKLFKIEAFDLVITDIIMPEKEGIETITELRRDYPELKIIAISGGGRHRPEGYLELAKGLGATMTMVKPFERSEILAAVKNVLKA